MMISWSSPITIAGKETRSRLTWSKRPFPARRRGVRITPAKVHQNRNQNHLILVPIFCPRKRNRVLYGFYSMWLIKNERKIAKGQEEGSPSSQPFAIWKLHFKNIRFYPIVHIGICHVRDLPPSIFIHKWYPKYITNK